MKRIFREYRIELIAFLLALVGVFLLVERIEIRAMLSELLATSKGWLSDVANALLNGLNSYVRSFTLSDLVGWLLISSTAVFIIWRVRYHYLRSARWRANACPRCGSPLHRIRRTDLDRLLTRFLLPKGARYLCSNADCRWSGLRRRSREDRRHHAGSHQEQDVDLASSK